MNPFLSSHQEVGSITFPLESGLRLLIQQKCQSDTCPFQVLTLKILGASDF